MLARCVAKPKEMLLHDSDESFYLPCVISLRDGLGHMLHLDYRLLTCLA